MNPDSKLVRIVIDTNLCISMLIGKHLAELRQVFTMPQYQLAISEALIQELLAVTTRPKFAKYFKQDDVRDFIHFLKENSLQFKINNIPQRCRDPKDDFLLELAIIADADILLSGDTDLTDMKQIGHCQIMSAKEFLNMHHYTTT